ncbi:MAG: response regulator transcription factor [Chloroflexota bacterium]
MPSIRVLIVDDHPLFRDGIRALLDSLVDTESVGEASDGRTAVAMVDALTPQVVLMDLQLPEMHGIEATRRIVAVHPEIAVLVLSMSDDDESVFAAMRAGARGYVLKGADHDEIHRAIVAAAAGEAIFGPAVARRLMALFSAPRARGPGSDAFPDLTERELEILELIARGNANATIAERLGLSLKTVRNHVSAILNKLQVVDRATAIVRAREAGLGVESRDPG